MLDNELKNKINSLWETFWTGDRFISSTRSWSTSSRTA